MFGLFRLYLSMAVVLHHLLRVPSVGGAAVFAFFTLSGFLMTHILARTYGFAPSGFGAYLVNRCLRLLPAYWVAILIALLTILVVGQPFAHGFNRAFGIPDSPADWVMNLTMIFPSLYPNSIEPRLFPIVWTLTVEFFYYVVLGLGATRTRMMAMIMVLAGLGYHLFGLVTGQDFDFHYHSILAGALPFGAGGLAYHHREALGRLLGNKASLMLGLHMATLALFALAYRVDVTMINRSRDGALSQFIDLGNLAAAILVSALTIGALYRPSSYVIGAPLDTLLGKYSYPVYLLHLQFSMLISFTLFGHRVSGANVSGLIGFALAMAATLALSWMITRLIEPQIDRIREQVKLGRAARRDNGAISTRPMPAPSLPESR